jgi:anti-sigma factor RsiW
MLRCNDETLNGYIDGALDPESAFEVGRTLALDPKKAARTAAYSAQSEALHALYDHVAAQPVPARLLVPFRRHARRTNRRRFCEAALAAIFSLAMLAAGGRALQAVFPPAAPVPAHETSYVPV